MAMRAPSQVFSFTAGMLDPELEARPDIKNYYSGARDLTNMLGLPQGGIQTRPGLVMDAELPEAAGGALLAAFEHSVDKVFLIAVTHLQAHVYKQGQKVATLTTPYTAAMLPALRWVQGVDTMILCHPDVRPKRLQRQGSDSVWGISDVPLVNIPTYDFGAGAESTWGDTRGWPISCFIYEGRLYFGGSKSRPFTLWGSVAGSYWDFKYSTDNSVAQKADEAVEITLDSGGVQHLFGMSTLFLFTTKGLHAVAESPVTPENIYAKAHSAIPVANVRPVEVEGAVVFVSLLRNPDGSQTSQAVHEILYNADSEGYVVQPLSLLAYSLMRAPVDMALRLGSDANSANHLFVINVDGSAAILNSRRSQQITAWTFATTEGQFLRCAVVGNQAYFLVKRSVAGVDRYFIERLDNQARLDCSAVSDHAEAVTAHGGFAHLDGQEVTLFGDGYHLGEAVVAGGQIAAPYAVKRLEAGFNFNWAVETMPVEAQLTDGTLIGNSHRLTAATIRHREATAYSVNGRRWTARRFGAASLDEPPEPDTGLAKIRLLGWQGGRRGGGATVRIEGDAMTPAAILSITAEVAN